MAQWRAHGGFMSLRVGHLNRRPMSDGPSPFQIQVRVAAAEMVHSLFVPQTIASAILNPRESARRQTQPRHSPPGVGGYAWRVANHIDSICRVFCRKFSVQAEEAGVARICTLATTRFFRRVVDRARFFRTNAFL
jgi:hypothetical protein